MTEDEFREKLLNEYRSDFDAGDYRKAIQALLFCGGNGYPLPEWVLDEAEGAMKFTFRSGGAPGRGKTGGHAKRLQRDKIHRERHHIADWELGRRRYICGGTREEAFERASQRLAGTPAQGEAAQIERSYNRIQKEMREP